MDSLAACKTSVCCPMFNFLPGVVRDALHSSIPFFDRLILALQQNFNIEKIERKSRDKEECRRKKITGSIIVVERKTIRYRLDRPKQSTGHTS